MKKVLHTGLQGLLQYVIGEGSDAFVRYGCQGKVVLCVWAETFDNI